MKVNARGALFSITYVGLYALIIMCFMFYSCFVEDP